MKRHLFALSLLVGLSAPLATWAGPFADFEDDLRDAYGAYRTALFQSNQGNAEGTAKALQALSDKWTALDAQWRAAPPPQYAEDAGFAQTLTSAEAVIAQALQEGTGGDLGQVHVTLEALRAEVAALHARNGIIGFSDRMNAYHAQMEAILGLDLAKAPDGGLTALTEGGTVLAFLAADLAAHPAPESADPAYAPAFAAVMQSVQALQDAPRAGDLAAAKAALGGLKGPYSKFFVKFG